MNVKKDIQQQSIQENPWNVYLSGEIHSDWREQIKEVLNTYQVPSQKLHIVMPQYDWLAAFLENVKDTKKMLQRCPTDTFCYD